MYGPPRVCKQKRLMAVWSEQMVEETIKVFSGREHRSRAARRTTLFLTSKMAPRSSEFAGPFERELGVLAEAAYGCFLSSINSPRRLRVAGC
jgi:hypothetical protein